MFIPAYEEGARTKDSGIAASIMMRPHHRYASLKRVLDIAVSLLLIIILFPCFVLIGCAIRFESKGPSLFRQRRTGLHGKPFYIYKLRTMTVQQDGDYVPQASRFDERVTRLGRILRCMSIDEFPQLLNVLRGDMSLVGPRPHAMAHDKYYESQIADYIHRYSVRPGITGWAQINDARGETPTIDHMRRRVELDLWYINHVDFKLDLLILCRTAITVWSDSQEAY